MPFRPSLEDLAQRAAQIQREIDAAVSWEGHLKDLLRAVNRMGLEHAERLELAIEEIVVGTVFKSYSLFEKHPRAAKLAFRLAEPHLPRAGAVLNLGLKKIVAAAIQDRKKLEQQHVEIARQCIEIQTLRRAYHPDAP